MKKKDKNKEVKRYSYTKGQLIIGGIILMVVSVALFITIVVISETNRESQSEVTASENNNVTYIDIYDPDDILDGTYSIDEEYILQEILPEMPSVFDYEGVNFSLNKLDKESVSVIFTVTDESFGRFVSENLHYITSTADEDEIKWHFTSTMHKSHSLLKEQSDINIKNLSIYTESSSEPIVISYGLAVEMPILDNTKW